MDEILCACGCGSYREKYDSNGRKRRYINHHHPNGQKGKTFEEFYGEERAKELKSKISIKGMNRKQSKETLKKLSEIRKGKKKNKEWIRKIKKSNLGKKRDFIARRNISHAKKRYLIENPKELDRIRGLQVPNKFTSIEIKIQDFLRELGIEFFTHQYIKEIEHSYRCDIFIPVQEGIIKKTIIECDGDYWHNYPYGKEIDLIHTQELEEQGFKVLRLWECEIRKMNLDNLRIKIL